ncbi:MAG: DUF2510 domain-containing protein [Acidimicrobiales bacterium]|nr:DUF2510 domain-containing protein [Acidimicrobiales bacterium]
MSDGTAANWHPDPYGRHQLRYWDGTTWTRQVIRDLSSDEAFFMSDSPFFDILSEDFDDFNETS